MPALPNPAGAVYGTIAIGTLLAAESAQRESYGQTVEALLIALGLYWLARSYVTFTARRLEKGTPAWFEVLRAAIADEFSTVVGAAAPVGAVVIAWIGGAKLSTAIAAGVWTAAAMILAFEVMAALRARLSGPAMIIQVVLGGLMGFMVVALMAVLK